MGINNGFRLDVDHSLCEGLILNCLSKDILVETVKHLMKERLDLKHNLDEAMEVACHYYKDSTSNGKLDSDDEWEENVLG